MTESHIMVAVLASCGLKHLKPMGNHRHYKLEVLDEVDQTVHTLGSDQDFILLNLFNVASCVVGQKKGWSSDEDASRVIGHYLEQVAKEVIRWRIKRTWS